MPITQQQQQNEKQLTAILTITPTKKPGEVNIEAEYQTLRTRDEGCDMISCFIPAFNIHYSAPDLDEGLRRSPIMVKTFLSFWVEKQSPKKFISQLLKLGFRADALTNKKLAHGETIKKKTSLNLPTRGLIPPEFKNSDIVEQRVEAEMGALA